VKVAAAQMSCSWDRAAVLSKAEAAVRKAAEKGANIVLLQELFETPYFCQEKKFEYIELATALSGNPAVKRMSRLARELDIVIPVSFFERAGNTSFNSTAVIDAGGAVLGVYRKTHIPDGMLFQEKYYFSPGDTGFKVWNTKFGRIGIGVCWDQWFPEAARVMAIMGAELILYPTAIGYSYLEKEGEKTAIAGLEHWRRTMQGHAAANMVPVIVSNRIGTEETERTKIEFYGSSFITDGFGEIIRSADRRSETVLVAEFDLDELLVLRRKLRLFRDRRPEMYGGLLNMDLAQDV
jgi:N-carbamoylputrescine amidase